MDIKIILLFLLVAAAVGFYFFNGIQNVSVEKFEITGVSAISADYFSITGNLYVKNPSQVDIPVDSVDYEVVMKENNQLLGTGSLNSFIVTKSQTTKIPLNQQIQWTSGLAAASLTKDKVFIVIKGNVHVHNVNYPIPFSQEIDIKEYIDEFAGSQINQPAGGMINAPSIPEQENSDDSKPDSIVPGNPLGMVN